MSTSRHEHGCCSPAERHCRGYRFARACALARWVRLTLPAYRTAPQERSRSQEYENSIRPDPTTRPVSSTFPLSIRQRLESFPSSTVLTSPLRHRHPRNRASTAARENEGQTPARARAERPWNRAIEVGLPYCGSRTAWTGPPSPAGSRSARMRPLHEKVASKCGFCQARVC